MATGLTAGRIYLIESEAANQDWITNDAGDPDDIDLDNFTGAYAEGFGFVFFDIPRGFMRTSHTGAIVTASGAGGGYDERNAARFYEAMSRGFRTRLTKANLVDEFIMSDRHTSGDPDIFKRYYMIWYFGTNSHLEFTDQNNVRQSYCKGIAINISTQWIDSKSLVFLIRINWASVWRLK